MIFLILLLCFALFGIIKEILNWNKPYVKIYDKPIFSKNFSSKFSNDLSISATQKGLFTGLWMLFCFLFIITDFWVFLVLIIICAIIDACNTFFNTPKFTIPPRYKNNEGPVQAELRRRRERKNNK